MKSPASSESAGMTVYNIPLPPSVNNLYFNLSRGGRAKTERYRNWIASARWSLLAQKARPIVGQVRLTILVNHKSRADLENHAKATIDLLVAHGILEDDCKKFVRGISLEWSPEVEGVRVIIEPATIKKSIDPAPRRAGRYLRTRHQLLAATDREFAE
jgi:Holliday junction resolvase RusA-like endonuclease